ncbi:MAG: hypothetical protein K0S65_5745 [Labilithrix sp.]|nr:hypothetical protein [Labilithrix sp.]
MPVRHDAATLFALGARGELDGLKFSLAGRTCVRGRRGATWNEWTMRFDDGRTLFLAESISGLTLYEEGSIVPDFSALAVGRPLDPGMVVVERGSAERIASWGAVEDAPASYAYVDLSARSGTVATIDFGPGAEAGTLPRVFVGRSVTAAELGVASLAGALPPLLPAPYVSRPIGVDVWLDIGEEGDLGGARFRVLGMISRSADVGEERVSWGEYLLFAPEIGARWLVAADGHWSLVEPVEPGRVEEAADTATFDGVLHEAISEGIACVDWASGKLPWEVVIGETSRVKDFASPPYLLTREWTDGELGWSRAVYVPPDVIAKAFGKRSLPRPSGRAPNQPVR